MTVMLTASDVQVEGWWWNLIIMMTTTTIMTRILTAGDVEVAGLLVKGEQGKVHWTGTGQWYPEKFKISFSFLSFVKIFETLNNCWLFIISLLISFGIFDIVSTDVCLIFLIFVATNVYALFKKSVKQICNLNVQYERGGGEVMFFLTMLKKAELAGDGIHPLPGWGPIRIAFCRSLVLDVGEGEGSQV